METNGAWSPMLGREDMGEGFTSYAANRSLIFNIAYILRALPGVISEHLHVRPPTLNQS